MDHPQRSTWVQRLRSIRATRELADVTMRRSLRGLTPSDRRILTEAQVEATRPIVSGVIFSGAVMLAVTGLFEGTGLAPDIGYPWWLVELAALAVAACALATWHLRAWPIRLLMALLGTALTGVFLSIAPPGSDAWLATRTGLFQLLPLVLLGVMVRTASLVALVALMLVLAAVRIAFAGAPMGGLALYWLFTFTSIGFGLLLGGYRTDFAVAAFHARRQLRRQASTDELTGLLNRAGWNRLGGELFERATGQGRALSLVLFDIDHFKRINDTWGHAAGDAVLQRLGHILTERQGGNEHAARLGGEEFVVMLSGETPEAVEGFAQRVRRDFAQAARDQQATVSAGVAHGLPGETLAQQLRRADDALYRAKAEGRDRMVVAPG